MSADLEFCRRLDVAIERLAKEQVDQVAGLCFVCGKQKTACYQNSLVCVCLDCYPTSRRFIYDDRTRVPQGDDLLRLPRERFTKKFH